jgi:uncharacterized protein (TIGR02271 family)
MSQTQPIRVTGRNGLEGFITGPIAASGPGGQPVLVQLSDGRKVQVPASELILLSNGTYFLPYAPEELQVSNTRSQGPGPGQESETLVLPVIAEQLKVQKRQVITGGVRVGKVVREREELVDEPLLQEKVQVERVPINQVVEAVPQVRYEGETMVIPILEEIVVVQKRLLVKEELRITKQRQTTSQPQQVTLRSEEPVIEPLPGSAQPADSANSFPA